MAATENVLKPSVPLKAGKCPNMKLSIVIPAYNEEKRIKRTLECLVERFNGSCEILVVSESNDKTDDIVTEFSKNSATVKLVTSTKRLGKGRRLQERC